jgi:hypothetical protein
MDTLHGTVFSVEVNRGEICLLFGSRTLTTGKGMETVVVSNRIILNPFTAKRLFVLLRRVMNCRSRSTATICARSWKRPIDADCTEARKAVREKPESFFSC